MPEPLRLRNYRTYGTDGKSWAEYKCDDKNQVFVALVLGLEPKVINDPSEFLNIDEIILKMADHIKKNTPKKTNKKKS